MYSEYFNYNNCTTGITYYNYSNYCTTAHTNYSNVCTTAHSDAINACSVYHSDAINACSVYHANYTNVCSTSHYNSRYAGINEYTDAINYCSTTYTNANNYCSTTYTNANNYCSTAYTNTHTNTCSTYHNDAANDCLTTQAYVNHVNYSNPNSGNPIALTWESGWTGNSLSSEFIEEGIEAIKNLRDNIVLLGSSKAQNTVTVAAVSDAVFNDSNATTTEKVEDTNYNTMATNLNALITQVNPSMGSVSLVSENSLATKAQWETLKIKSDLLSAYQSTNYANTRNYTAAAYANHANTVNS